MHHAVSSGSASASSTRRSTRPSRGSDSSGDRDACFPWAVRQHAGMAQTASSRTASTVENEAQRVFALQRAAYARSPFPTYDARVANLKKLDRLLVDNATAIAE